MIWLFQAKKNPNKLWVQKNNNHRGIKILSIEGLCIVVLSLLCYESLSFSMGKLANSKLSNMPIHLVCTWNPEKLAVHMCIFHISTSYVHLMRFIFDPCRNNQRLIILKHLIKKIAHHCCLWHTCRSYASLTVLLVLILIV